MVVELHRFFIATSRAVFNHDDSAGTALDPLVWSAGALPKRRRLVHAVSNCAMLLGPAPILGVGWVGVLPALCVQMMLMLGLILLVFLSSGLLF